MYRPRKTGPLDNYIARNAREYMTRVGEYVAYNDDRSVIVPAFAAFCERVPEAARVLDLGCGPGWETQSLHDRGYEAIGLDLSAAFCSYARRQHPAEATSSAT